MIEKRRVIYGMDSDTVERDIENGYARKNLNVRIGSSDSENQNAVETVRGNEIRYIVLPEGDNTCIGCYEYKRDNLIYYFNHNSEGEHNIIQYNLLQDISVVVMISPILNFSLEHFITHVDVIDLDNENQLIHFVDRLNPPRKFNLSKSIRAFNSLVGDKYELPIKESVIDAIKYQPLFPPNVSYDTDVNVRNNYLNKETWQFRTRYIYDDFEKSAWSPISVKAIPLLSENSIANNYILVKTPIPGDLVTRIEIAGRSELVRDFVLLETVEIGRDTPTIDGYSYKFFNDKVYTSIDVNESLQPYDFVPQIAGTQAYIDGNRIVYGDIVEGYDNVDIDADLDIQYEPKEKEVNEGELNTIKGKIYIKTYLNVEAGRFQPRGPITERFAGAHFEEGQPIRYLGGESQTPENIRFGGFAPYRDKELRKEVGTSAINLPFLPLGGFTVYLAGTKNYAISKQPIYGRGGSGNVNERDIQNTDTGVFHASTYKGLRAIATALSPSDSNPDNSIKDFMYSEFTIENVPDGQYILRVASHNTTQEDINSGRYQTTSTNAFHVGGQNSYECEVHVSGGEIKEIGSTYIMDCATGFAGLAFIGGYYVDKTNEDASTLLDYLGNKRIPYARLDFLNQRTFDVFQTSIAFFQTNFGDTIIGRNPEYSSNKLLSDVYSDHNGYFFSTRLTSSVDYSLIDNAIVGNVIGNVKLRRSVGGLEDNYTNPMENINPSELSGNNVTTSNSSLRFVIAENNEPDITNFASTTIRGRVVTNEGVTYSGGEIVAQYGDIQLTDSSGEYEIVVYANAYQSAINGITQSNYRGRLYSYQNRNSQTFFFSENSSVLNILTLSFNANGTTTFNLANPLTIRDSIISSRFIIGKTVFKRGSINNFGVVYYDRAGRHGAVNISDLTDVYIPFDNEEVEIGLVSLPTSTEFKDGYYPVISGVINNTPPDWATHYSWVRTRKTNINNYIQFTCKNVEYLTDDDLPSNINDGTKLSVDVSNLNLDYIKVNPKSLLVYTFTPKDRIRFIKKSTGEYYGEYLDYEILTFDEATSILTFENEFNAQLVSDGDLVELYTPKLREDTSFYYEFGEFYEIGEPGTEDAFHKGSTQDQTSTAPAISEFKSGDTYLRTRLMPTEDVNDLASLLIESDYYTDSENQTVNNDNIGRPNIEDVNTKRLRRPTTIRYSSIFMPETAINGLSQFFDINFESYDRAYGSIQKLHQFNKRLDCYQELKVGKILLGENVMFDQFDQGNVASSEKVLSGKIIYYVGEYGIGTQPESFCFQDNRRYFVDYRKGAVLRLSNDGLTAISDVKFSNYFMKKFQAYLSSEKTPSIWTSYDIDNSELVVSLGGVLRDAFTSQEVLGINFGTVSFETRLIGNINADIEFDLSLDNENTTGFTPIFNIERDTVNGQYIVTTEAEQPSYARKLDVNILPETLAFSETTKHWTTFYSFIPEAMCSAGVNIVTFQNGQLFLHNENLNHGVFYGNKYPSESWIPFNAESSKNKIVKAISLETSVPYSVIIETINGQITSNEVEDFYDEQEGYTITDGKENIFYSHVWRNENTVNEEYPKINGDVMRDTSFLVKLTTLSEDKELLYAVNLNYAPSERSNK